jgi:signal transduction histidine kinase
MSGRYPEFVCCPLTVVAVRAAGWLLAVLLLFVPSSSHSETNSVATIAPPSSSVGSLPAAVLDDRHSMFFKLLRIFSPKLREEDRTIATLIEECNNLPTPPAVRQPTSRGFRVNINDPDVSEQWVQVDLGSVQPINGIGIISAKATVVNRVIADYGFPLRYRLEISDKADFSQSQMVGDFSKDDQPKPDSYPIFVPVFGAMSRYVRITVTKFRSEENHEVFALGELMVFSHGLNVAVGRPVSSPHSVEKALIWGRQLLVDGRSYLGPPVDEKRPSPTRGYLGETATNGLLDSNHWVQIDLGKAQSIDQIQVFPAHISESSDNPDYGLPVNFSIQVGDDPEMTVAHTLYDNLPTGGTQMLNPIIVPGDGRMARYLRIRSTQLREMDSKRFMALAEIQVYSGGQNIALKRPVTASDAASSPDWSPNYLTDGYSSDYEIVDFSRWFIGLARRGELLRKLNDLVSRRKELEETTATWVIATTGGIILATGLVWAGSAWKIRKHRRHELRRLRQQIASDLHDAIGSNLGSIALISGLASDRVGSGSDLHQDFTQIQRVAEQTTEALRDVVWLTDPRGSTMAELLARMRETAAQMLRGLEYEMNISDTVTSQSASPTCIHHTFLCFKETLHNAVKHAHASQVNIQVWIEQKKLFVKVQDNGVGFDPTKPAVGRGLRSARERAAQLRGDFQIESAPGKGSTITFVATLWFLDVCNG